MSPHELKTSIQGLEPGMYVIRLDRPWIETPFPLQGFLIEKEKDIELLGRFCSYVYIDTERGPSPQPEYWVTNGAEKLKLHGEEPLPIEAFPKRKDGEYEKLRKCFYEISTSFEEELANAKEIKEKVDSTLKKVLNDLQNGKKLDIESVKRGIEATVSSIVRNPSAFSFLVMMEKSDDYTYARSLATSVWCAQFGRHLGLERGDINDLALGGMLLDIGKMEIPQELLNKTGAITEEERKHLRMHLDYSVRILARSRSIPASVLRMVATHHERADGSGYPEGVTNDVIPMYGRIAGIVDTYDAITSNRPYNDVVYTPHEAINELYKYRNTFFQEELVEQFIQTVGLYPTGSLVEFESGEVAIILEVNDLKRLNPTVMLVLDNKKQPMSEFIKVDLSGPENHSFKLKNALPYGAYGIKMNELFL